jgi:hypothetical protein
LPAAGVMAKQNHLEPDAATLEWFDKNLYCIGENSWSRPHTALRLAWLALGVSRSKRNVRTIWRFLAGAWSGFDLIPHAEYERLFRRIRKHWTPDCMIDTEHGGAHSLYDALPDHMVIYRGQDATHEVGLAWTLDRDVAERFSGGHRSMANEHPVVLVAEVAKSDVAFVSNDRDEREVVIFNRVLVRAAHHSSAGCPAMIEPMPSS